LLRGLSLGLPYSAANGLFVHILFLFLLFFLKLLYPFFLSLKRIDTSVALSMVEVAHAPVNCDSMVKFSARFEGISL